MATYPEATKKPASAGHEKVRIEVTLPGDMLSHEVRTDQFIKSAGVSRVGEQFHWVLGIVRVYMGRGTIVQLLQKSLQVLDDEEALEVMLPKLRELEAHGLLRRR